MAVMCFIAGEWKACRSAYKPGTMPYVLNWVGSVLDGGMIGWHKLLHSLPYSATDETVFDRLQTRDESHFSEVDMASDDSDRAHLPTTRLGKDKDALFRWLNPLADYDKLDE